MSLGPNESKSYFTSFGIFTRINLMFFRGLRLGNRFSLSTQTRSTRRSEIKTAKTFMCIFGNELCNSFCALIKTSCTLFGGAAISFTFVVFSGRCSSGDLFNVGQLCEMSHLVIIATYDINFGSFVCFLV